MPSNRKRASAQTEPVHHSSPPCLSVGNRRKLLWSLSPVLIVMVLCLSRWGQQRLSQKEPEPVGQMTAAQAQQIASTFCSRASNQPCQVVATRRCEHLLPRSQKALRHWEVECDSSDSRLVLRIDADTKQITRVNRCARDGTAYPAAVGEAVPRAEAEKQARFYLSLLGISPKGLEPVQDAYFERRGAVQAKWTFKYRRNSRPGQQHMISVSVDKVSGALIDSEIYRSL